MTELASTQRLERPARNNSRWLTTGKAAKMVGCSTRTIRRAIEDGTITARRRSTGRWLVREYEIRRYTMARKRASK